MLIMWARVDMWSRYGLVDQNPGHPDSPAYWVYEAKKTIAEQMLGTCRPYYFCYIQKKLFEMYAV